MRSRRGRAKHTEIGAGIVSGTQAVRGETAKAPKIFRRQQIRGRAGSETASPEHRAEACRIWIGNQRRVSPVDSLEQIVESQRYEDKTSLADKCAGDAKAKQRLVCRDVVGRRRCVSVDDQLVGNIAHGEETNDRDEYIQQSR